MYFIKKIGYCIGLHRGPVHWGYVMYHVTFLFPPKNDSIISEGPFDYLRGSIRLLAERSTRSSQMVYLTTHKVDLILWEGRNDLKQDIQLDHPRGSMWLSWMVYLTLGGWSKWIKTRYSTWSSQRFDLIILDSVTASDHKMRVYLIMSIKFWRDYLII